MITGLQIRAARCLLNWAPDDLAKEAGLSVGTIRRLEALNAQPLAMLTDNYTKLIDAFAAFGVTFVDEPGRLGVIMVRR